MNLYQKLDLILQELSEIKSMISDSHVKEEPAYITEQEAKTMLGRGTTWFWELRKAGLPHSKLGGQVYYKRKDLLELLEKGTQTLTKF